MPRKRTTPTHQWVFVKYLTSTREPGAKYPVQIPVGTAVPADHPIVDEHPDVFSDEPTLVWPRDWVAPVEQATAAPGETRATRRGD